ncbi:MAG: hypothetical protein WAV20_11120 [Blastocatellia bacterium]
MAKTPEATMMFFRVSESRSVIDRIVARRVACGQRSMVIAISILAIGHCHWSLGLVMGGVPGANDK